MTDSRRWASRNPLLQTLTPAEVADLAPLVDQVDLAPGDILHEPNEAIAHVYFLGRGVASLLAVMNSGAAVEVGTVGPEGMVGLMALFGGGATMPVRAICQVAGDAIRMPTDAFRAHIERSAAFRAIVQRYAQALMVQLTVAVACNRLHALERRLARWLLMTDDRMGGAEFYLTQEFLAVMLGVQRPRVTVAARSLLARGLIGYRRGRMQIVDRAGLETVSCECYGTVRAAFDRLLDPGTTVRGGGT